MKNNGLLNFSLMPTGNTAGKTLLASHNPACPRCSSAVFNVSRRLTDLFWSVFIPLRRYRCISMKCSWEGTLREKKSRLPEVVRVAHVRETLSPVATPVPAEPGDVMEISARISLPG